MSLKIRNVVLLWILQMSLMASSSVYSASFQCDYPGINPEGIFVNGIDQAGLIRSAMFNVDFSQFGEVCFVARKVILPGQVIPSHIELELYQNGQKIYTLPESELPLLDGDDVVAVSFPKLGRDERKSIIVLVRGTTARAGEYLQPVLYLPEGHGFKPDNELSLNTTDCDTIAKVVSKVKKLLAQRNRTRN